MELREDKSLDQQQLGDLLGVSKSTISRLESGDTKLTVEMAYKIADALDASVTDVIGLEEAVQEDAIEVTPDPSSDLARLVKAYPDRLIYKVTTAVLADQGVKPGAVIIVEKAANADQMPKPLSLAVLTLHDRKNPTQCVTILRQFVPPNQFITNSSSESAPPLSRTHEDLRLIGTMLFAHTPLS